MILMMANVGLISLLKPSFETYAASTPATVTISNNNFNNDTRSSYPFAPSSYTAYVKNQTSSSLSGADKIVSAGVIKLDDEEYTTKFSQNVDRGTSLDKYVLMIDSTEKEDDVEIRHTVNYGYRTSSAFTLSADSKYMISVDVFTAHNANIGGLYLYNSEDDTVYSSIRNINSYNDWTTYYFFVSTNNTESLSLKLGMYLEGAGTILFDNIGAFQLNDNQYVTQIANLPINRYAEESNADHVISNYVVSGSKLVNSLDTLDTHSFVESNRYESDVDNMDMTSTTNSDGENSFALKIANTKDSASYVSYSTDDDFINVEQNKTYRVSVNVKTTNLSGNANLKLVQTNLEDNETAVDSDIIKITSNTSNNVKNNYTTYSFYIKGHPKKDVSYKLVAGLGDSNTLTTGEFYISNVEISQVTHSAYANASSTTSKTIDLVTKGSKDYSYANSTTMLANGAFDAIEINDSINAYPATPSSWTVEADDTANQVYGVINTQSTAFNTLSNKNTSVLINPYENKNENVLMMYTEDGAALSYTSSTKSLQTNSYHRFDIDVQTQNSPVKLSLVTTKDSKEIELTAVNVPVTGAKNWQTVSLYIYTGYQSVDVSLKATLASESYGYAYLDNAKFDSNVAPTADEFNAISSSDFTAKCDMSDFSSSKDLYSHNENESVKFDIVNLDSDLSNIIYDTEHVNNFASLDNRNVLMINAYNDTNYTLTSNIGFKFEASKYYKVSIKAYTQNIQANDSSVDTSLLGAGIKLSGYTDSFTHIISDNVWTTYTFYVYSETETTSYLELSLGNEDAGSKGYVFFGDIEVNADITETEYNAKTNSSTVKVLKTESTSEDTNSDTNTDEEPTSNNTWIYLIPSLLTALAIIIAIVGVTLRKVKFKKRTKKTKTAYDRNKTVSKQYYTRKATTLREEKLREMNKDLEKINNERKKFEDEYKQDLTKLREMKIKRATPAEIAKLEKEMKKNQKLSASLGQTANKINSEIEYAKTEAYLNNLIKRLQRDAEANQLSNKDNEETK